MFGELMRQEGNLDEAEYQIYDTISKKIMKECPLTAVIYLKCTPEVCIERIRKRNRPGEEVLPLAYIKKVHERHEKWIGSLSGVPTLTIDTGVYDIYNENSQAEVTGLIRKFIGDLKSNQPRHHNSPESESKENSEMLKA